MVWEVLMFLSFGLGILFAILQGTGILKWKSPSAIETIGVGTLIAIFFGIINLSNQHIQIIMLLNQLIATI